MVTWNGDSVTRLNTGRGSFLSFFVSGLNYRGKLGEASEKLQERQKFIITLPRLRSRRRNDQYDLNLTLWLFRVIERNAVSDTEPYRTGGDLRSFHGDSSFLRTGTGHPYSRQERVNHVLHTEALRPRRPEVSILLTM